MSVFFVVFGLGQASAGFVVWWQRLALGSSKIQIS